MTSLHVDVESFSAADLTKVGHYRYAQDPSTRMLLFGFAVDDDPIEVVDLYHGERLQTEILRMLLDPSVVKWAHNAAFERVMLQEVMGIPCPPEQWRCTATWARSLALPAGLGQVAALVGADVQKQDQGKSLVIKLCTPKFGGPERNQDLWPKFIEYNRADVGAERCVHTKLKNYPMTRAEWQLWELDQRINDRGMPIDMDFVRAAGRMADANAREVEDDVRRSTGMDNPNSGPQWLEWLSWIGVEAENMRRATVDAMRADEGIPAEVRTVLDMRRELASSSLAKFDTLMRTVGKGSRVRGTYTFYGAGRTGRWSGKQFQPQNLPRGVVKDEQLDSARKLVAVGDVETIRMLWPEVSPVIASTIRTAIKPPAGRALAVADLASIETVMIAWAAGCETLLNVFRDGKDVYKAFGTRLFHVAYEAITKAQRTLSKPAVLGCGYGMGAAGLQAYAQSMGVTMTLDEARKHVAVYRETYPEIVKFWWEVEQAAFEAVKNKETNRVGPFTFRCRGSFLFIDLPSGRSLAYYQPRVGEGKYGEEMTYLSGSEYSKQLRLSTYGPKFVENIVQAIARDVEAAGMIRADAAGLELVLHSHDELGAEVDADQAPAALATLIDCMTRPIKWCPDAPIRAAGWHGPYYRKD